MHATDSGSWPARCGKAQEKEGGVDMKIRNSLQLKYRILASLTAGMFSILPVSYALPTGMESTTASQVTSGSTMSVTGTVENNLINWNS